MAVFSVAKMNKARHKQAYLSEKNKEKPKEEEKPISEEEHNRRLELLKNIGLLKG